MSETEDTSMIYIEEEPSSESATLTTEETLPCEEAELTAEKDSEEPGVETEILGDGEPPEETEEPRDKVTHWADHDFENNVTVAGTLRAKIFVHPFGARFADEASLLREYPTPRPGMWATTGPGVPGVIWVCIDSGKWEKLDPSSLTKEDIENIIAGRFEEVNRKIEELRAKLQQSGTGGSAGGASDYAAEAGHATEADHAKNADRATIADIAMDIDSNSPVYDRFVRKDRADRTPHALAVGGKFTAETGLHAGNFVAGFSGAAIDGRGNAEVESIIVRSYMKVFELIYNRLNALEGNTSFADSGTIDAIISRNGDTCTALMRRRWEGDFTAFQEGDIIYGYVNDLRNENGGTNLDYYKAWAYVTAVDRDANTLTLVRYADADVPAGKNFDTRPNMLISRWGNITDKSRQSSFYISCEDGNLVELMGVDSPILREGNYGTILGRLPDGFAAQLGIDGLINPDQPYLYARGIVVQDLIRVNYRGLKIRTPQWRGEWNADTAASDTEYYRITDDTEDWVTLDGTLYRYISEERSTLRPDEDPQHWVALTGRLSAMWEIVPSVNTIHIGGDGYSTDLVECIIRCNSMAGVEDITTPERLDTFGLELVFSLDGVSYNEFWVRDGAEIEGTGLLVGSNNVPWLEVRDNIMLDLREKATGKTLHRKYIPVTRDGESIPGEDGKDGGYTEFRYLVNNGYDPLPAGKLPDRDADAPAGWATDHGAVIYGEQSLWQITARKTSDGHLAQGARWTEPVMLTGIPGKNGVSRPGPLAYPAGVYDPVVTYTSDAGQDPVKCPVVLDNGQYYMLLPGKSYCGLTAQYSSPSADYAGNPDTVWEMLTRFSSVFADILMANFGKIGSAVFWNNLLISQYGKDSTGNDTDQYQGFDNTTRFTPNLLIDFLYGLLRCNNVDITGRVNATSGQIGNLLIRGNRLIGLDDEGVEVVSIGVGELTDIGNAFTERALSLSMLSTGVGGSTWGYSDSVLTVNGGRDINLGVSKEGEHRLSPSYDDTHLYCTFGFAVGGDASTLTFDGMNAYATTTSGNPFAQVTGTASLYHDQDEGRTNRVARWDIGQSHSVGGLSEGGYIVDIAITVDGLQGDWTGHIEFETGFVKTLVAGNQAQRVEVASDGLLCYQGADRYFMYSKRSGMEVRFGNFGLQLGVNGLRKLENNTWKDI